MSKPAERYAELLDQIIGPFDLSHDFGRKGAYEATIEYARLHLIEDPHCNEFLLAAAKRLGFAAITRESLEGRVKLPKEAWLDLWISDEDDEVALTGTREGIQYLIDLLTQLRDATLIVARLYQHQAKTVVGLGEIRPEANRFAERGRHLAAVGTGAAEQAAQHVVSLRPIGIRRERLAQTGDRAFPVGCRKRRRRQV